MRPKVKKILKLSIAKKDSITYNIYKGGSFMPKNRKNEENKLHNKFNSIMMRIFGYKEIVIEILLYLVSEDWVNLIDFDSLELKNKDFITPEELDDFQSDMLWSAKLKNSNKEFYSKIFIIYFK